jgi:hypothetical protein
MDPRKHHAPTSLRLLGWARRASPWPHNNHQANATHTRPTAQAKNHKAQPAHQRARQRAWRQAKRTARVPRRATHRAGRPARSDIRVCGHAHTQHKQRTTKHSPRINARVNARGAKQNALRARRKKQLTGRVGRRVVTSASAVMHAHHSTSKEPQSTARASTRASTRVAPSETHCARAATSNSPGG